jgi:hypothetical protein
MHNTDHLPSYTPSYIPTWVNAEEQTPQSMPPAMPEDAGKEQAAARRKFLRAAGRAAVGITGIGAATLAASHEGVLGASKTLTFGDIPTLGLLALPGLNLKADVKVLNYALALEDLESELYRQCVARLTGGGYTQQGVSIPGLNLSHYLPDVYHIMQFAGVEAAHREFLRGALKLDGLIPGLGIHPKKYQFGVENMSREQILAMLIDVEATGTMAYLGAIPFFRTKIFLTTAAGILGTEARHTAALQAIQNRLLMDKLIADGTPPPPPPLATTNNGIDTPMDPDAVLAKVSPFIVG